MSAPKYARIEFERRWLVNPAEHPRLDKMSATRIEDRYIDGTRLRLRRMSRADVAEIKWKLTRKYECDDPAARPIVTTYLTEAEFGLLRTLPARALTKMRYHLPIGGRFWSLDLFEASLAGLAILEAEAEDAAALAALVPPQWAAKEITGDPRWQCGALAWAQAIPEV